MRISICLILFGLFFIACQDANTNTSNDQQEVQESDAGSEVKSSPNYSSDVVSSTDIPVFIIENYKDGENPKSTISIDMGGSKIKVTDAVQCEVIERADYDQYYIPEEAIGACGGWWAGMGEYFYMFKSEEGDYYEIMRAQIGEEDKDFNGYPYLSIMKFVKKNK